MLLCHWHFVLKVGYKFGSPNGSRYFSFLISYVALLGVLAGSDPDPDGLVIGAAGQERPV
jgi:hypothetical protein